MTLVKFIKKIFHRLFYPVILECLFLIGIWRPAVQSHALNAELFIKINKKYWNNFPKGNKNILIEGHFTESGPNYLFRVNLAAKALQSVFGGGQSFIVVNGHSYNWSLSRKVCNSFGNAKWIFLGRKFLLLTPLLLLLAGVRTLISFIQIRKPEQILNISFDGIKTGDLIYDQILRFSKTPTVNTINWKVFQVIAQSWYYYYQYNLLFSLRRYHYYISTHAMYAAYGLICRVALKKGVKVIETNDIATFLHENMDENNLPTYHHSLNKIIKNTVSSENLNKKKLATREVRGAKNLQHRLESNIENIDALKAYSGKIYSKEKLCKTLNINVNDRIGFIAGHIFNDAPHNGKFLIFKDFYEWMDKTLEYCSMTKNINWIVKPHPASKLYEEEGVVEELVRSKKASNIYICPSDLNTGSLRHCADVILTVNGTIGLEYACLGIPSILSGFSCYSGFGFTHDPGTAAEYCQMIQDSPNLPRLNNIQISKALQIYDIWNEFFDFDNYIITHNVLANVWGSEGPINLKKAYDLMSKNLKNNDPKKLKLWKFVESLAEKDAKK
jgi:hypothetical protein